MKADGGALIYIVLAVISLIVSAVAKNKKKEMQTTSSKPTSSEPAEPKQPQQTTWQRELEDIFGKVLTQPEVVVERQEYAEPKPVVKKEVKANAMSEEGLKGSSNSISAVNSDQIISETPSAFHIEEEEHEFAGINFDDFELNKAVIYSEVLNRKYF